MRMDDFYIQEKIIFKVSINSKKSSFEAEGKKAKIFTALRKVAVEKGAGVQLGGLNLCTVDFLGWVILCPVLVASWPLLTKCPPPSCPSLNTQNCLQTFGICPWRAKEPVGENHHSSSAIFDLKVKSSLQPQSLGFLHQDLALLKLFLLPSIPTQSGRQKACPEGSSLHIT